MKASAIIAALELRDDTVSAVVIRTGGPAPAVLESYSETCVVADPDELVEAQVAAIRAILGKFITLEMLGIYSIGFFLASVPLLLGRPLAIKIVFPLYFLIVAGSLAVEDHTAESR